MFIKLHRVDYRENDRGIMVNMDLVWFIEYNQEERGYGVFSELHSVADDRRYIRVRETETEISELIRHAAERKN